MSASALSRLIQRMEQELDCRLLLRNNRSVQLTRQGKQLLTFAEQQNLQWDTLKNAINQQSEHLAGKLHIFCSVTAAYSHLPNLLDRFRQQHPAVEIILTTGDAADALSRVQDNSVDVAIAAKPEHLSHSLCFKRIAEVPLAVIAPIISAELTDKLQQATINWQEIPIILPDHGPARKRFDQWFSGLAQTKPNIYATVSGHEALVSMVALGCGIGIAPKVVVDNSPVKNRVKYIDDLGTIAPFELGISCLQRKRALDVVEAFFNAVE